MTKILFIGDIHIKHNNINKLKILMARLGDALPNIDFIVLAGDVLDAHEKIDSQLMNLAYELIRALRRIAKVFILVGNHDYINNQQFLTDNHWMNGLKEWHNVIVVDKPIKERCREKEFVMIPYVFPGRFKEALNGLDDDWTLATCIFAHQEFRGCKMGAIVSAAGDVWALDDPLVISGHIHEKQQPQINVYYPGSVINHAFGYEAQGMYIFDFDDTTTTTTTERASFSEEYIDLHFDKTKTIYAKSDAIIAEKDMIPANRFNISGTGADIVEFKESKIYEALKRKNIKIVFSLLDRAPTFINAKQDRCVFKSVLDRLIAEENDPELNVDYATLFV